MHYLRSIKIQSGCITLVTTKVISVIPNFVAPVAEQITQSADQARMGLMSRLIKGSSGVLQGLLKYFNGTAILTSVVLPSAGVFSVILILDLHDSEFTAVACSLSL